MGALVLATATGTVHLWHPSSCCWKDACTGLNPIAKHPEGRLLKVGRSDFHSRVLLQVQVNNDNPPQGRSNFSHGFVVGTEGSWTRECLGHVVSL